MEILSYRLVGHIYCVYASTGTRVTKDKANLHLIFLSDFFKRAEARTTNNVVWVQDNDFFVRQRLSCPKLETLRLQKKINKKKNQRKL